MAFKSFKYKLYSKGYHSAAQKSATSFFDSSYQYLRHNQGLVSLDTAIPQSFVCHVNPHPVVVANVNYSNVENVLDAYSDGPCYQSGVEQVPPGRKEEDAVLDDAIGVVPGRYTTAALRTRRKSDSYPFLSTPIRNNQVINEALSKNYYTTSTLATVGVQRDTVQQQKNADGSLRLEEQYYVSAWEPDTESCLNSETFLQTNIKEIERCVQIKDYNRVNAIYQALKRNGILPPVETFAQIMRSIHLRELDSDDLDNKMFQLLSCYQDLISNKLKPTDEIYTIIIGALLQGSITAYKNNNQNGQDFFKIGLDLFFASNLKRTRSFKQEILDRLLLAINFYPGHVKYSFVKSYVDSCEQYYKTEFFYIAMLGYAKLTNDNEAVKSLYEEFRKNAISKPILQAHKYEVYSMVLSGLVETGSLKLAVKLLDKMLTEVRESDGLGKNISLLLSNFLISVSKSDPAKAFQLWFEFSKLKWVPEFLYDFYVSLLFNSFRDWNTARKLYNYIFAMKPSLMVDRPYLKDYLLYPFHVKSVHSSTLHTALNMKDDEMIMKLLEESIVKNIKFEPDAYPSIFRYLRYIKCPDDYLLRFVKSHGKLLLASSARDQFEFLNALLDNFQSQKMLKKAADAEFFHGFCKSFDVAEHNVINYAGLIRCFEALWRSPQHIETYRHNLELHALLITRFYDPESAQISIENSSLKDFKDKLTEKFAKLATNYRKIHLDALKCSPNVAQAVKITDLPQEVQNYFSHPGEWDKSYPLDLSTLIFGSPNTGIKEFVRLSGDGYCFDFATYESLVKVRFVNSDIITKCMELCPKDEKSLAGIIENIGQSILKSNQEEILLNHPLFKTDILPHLTDSSLTKLAKKSNILDFISKIGFPEQFCSIALQAKYKGTIEHIFSKLFSLKEYSSILKYNTVVPCLLTSIVLKASIRSNSFEDYKTLRNKFKDFLGPEGVAIHSEYLITKGRIQKALDYINEATEEPTMRTKALYTFALFLKSFQGNVTCVAEVDDTLQLANSLTTYENFHEMISFYRKLLDTRLLHFREMSNLDKAVNLELTEQMLNNLYDALQFIDCSAQSVRDKFVIKLDNYIRFRYFLKLNVVTKGDFSQLFVIWKKAVPDAIDTLFNNIVELFYLNPTSKVLYISDGLSLHFDKEMIYEIIEDIGRFYESEGKIEHLEKVHKFQSVLNGVFSINEVNPLSGMAKL
ncbi:ribonuclease P Ecym_4601 [Eremothecium cymbalariae DBVPG|uniref:Uncharacterized protein n=1 Tax=Eremothecium cymbalariae (strain CBS 270.75 / DBVPG 7215 / KCTC 17166 / NRRL Y-17582) TaxID=931890 RepID=G8JSB0_ERECY|nr:hypothetical protein Ecym_4601 [Eremothecium cymbalariae DBVPG\